MVSASSVVRFTTQNITLPHIPELYDPNFLDVLLPPATGESVAMDVDVSEPKNAMMDALQSTANQTYTENGAPAYSSTLSPILDAFNGLNAWSNGPQLDDLLSKSWKEDPSLTLRLIWQLRSIHEGKSEKEGFYRAFGWLYRAYPRTAIANLSMLVSPVCPNKKKPEAPYSHGYWKDLLNIIGLATLDELDVMNATFLHHPRSPYTYPNRKVKKNPTPEAHAQFTAEAQARARAKRVRVGSDRHEILLRRLESPKYRALYVAVTRLFVDQLVKDLQVVWELEHLGPDVDRVALIKKISLAGKWAPTPGASHDRHTNISSAISLLLHHNRAIVQQPFPSALASFDPAQALSSVTDAGSPVEQIAVLRSYFHRWVLVPIRSLTLLPEPLMSANRWTEIRYNRVASICMERNTENFLKHDPEGFQRYLIDVESGKKSISGATLLPHDIVTQLVTLGSYDNNKNEKMPKLKEFKKTLAETRVRTLEAQWKSLITRLKESGSLDNAIAICDVSGSMGSFHNSSRYKSKSGSKYPDPIAPAIALSLVLAELATPPFNRGFITFSQNPKFVTLDRELSLSQTIQTMQSADWGMNTDFNAVFLKLLLPLAVKNKVPKEEMIKRLFVFSDMQFDEARRRPYSDWNSDEEVEQENKGQGDWKTNYDAVVDAYAAAGYDVPQTIFWDLSAHGTTEVTAEREGVAMMNGFSPSMMKVFMGEEEEVSEGEAEEEEWETVGKTKAEAEKEKFNPINVVKRAVMRPAYDGLQVVD